MNPSTYLVLAQQRHADLVAEAARANLVHLAQLARRCDPRSLRGAVRGAWSLQRVRQQLLREQPCGS
jgi:hypothetical protein